MKKSLLFPIVLLLLACGGAKKTRTQLNKGNYDTVIKNAVNKLVKNKTRKGSQKYVVLLEDAFAKALTRDMDNITFWKQDGSDVFLENIYETYQNIGAREESVRALLPLRIYEQNRNASFEFVDYTRDLLKTKEKLTNYLYSRALEDLDKASNKQDYREIYSNLDYLSTIKPDYANCRLLMDTAHKKGTNYVQVQLENETQMVLPLRVEEELLNFDSFKLDDFWTQYHSTPNKNKNYDIVMKIIFDDLKISPEEIRERFVSKEKVIKDGWEYLYNDQGEIVKDSLGDKIKIDKLVTVRCDLNEFTQFKAVYLQGNVLFTDIQSNQVINRLPLASEFIFENRYGTIDGDKRALDDDLRPVISARPMPFPPNEEMIYRAGEDLKNRLKDIITTQQFE